MIFSNPGLEGPAPGTTGKYLVLLREDAVETGIQALDNTAGVMVAHAEEFDRDTVDSAVLSEGEGIVFDELGVAVVDVPLDQTRALGVAMEEEEAILAVEPERVVYTLQDTFSTVRGSPVSTVPVEAGGEASSAQAAYLRGYQAAVNHLVGSVLGTPGTPDGVVEESIGAVFDETTDTWGLQATKVAASRYTGDGVKVAVLDTGIDERHPDFTGRSVTSASFIEGEAVQDRHGHGTHCIGTSCGPREPGQLPRYGVAYDSQIFVGKVLSNRGSGTDGGILGGIRWALNNHCDIVSMSLGAPTTPGQQYSRVFEQVARRALRQGMLIIAAAGNESQRPFSIKPVGHPANCPSIMAVAALDAQLKIARFSCGGVDPQGGQVDIAGPGVEVRSSWPQPILYNRISGTSMATPHVAGIAALHAEANPEARGRNLWSLMTQSARRIPLPSRDVGIGLVQAP